MIIFFAITSSILYLCGLIPYLYQVFHGRVVPHAFSWTVWAILSSINTYNLYHLDGLKVSLISPITRTSMLTIGAIIAWFFIKKIQIWWIDYISILLAIVCFYIAVHYGSQDAIIPTIIVDILVLIPTLKKVWNDPYSEALSAWFLVIFSQAFLLLSLDDITWSNSLFWIYVMLINAFVAIYIVLCRIYVVKKSQKTFIIHNHRLPKASYQW